MTLGIYPVYRAFLLENLSGNRERTTLFFCRQKSLMYISLQGKKQFSSCIVKSKRSRKWKKKATRKVILMNQITIYLFCLSCTRLIMLFKKQITLENQCFTGTGKCFIFKLHSSLAHIILLSHVTHIFIALPQSHYNKTDEPAVGKDVRKSTK